jgi:hypothetical protein
MFFKKLVLYSVVLTLASVLAPTIALAQSTPSNCSASQQAAVECFVANAVTADLTKPRYGMTLVQFEAYGAAVSTILQTHHTYLMVLGLSSAMADAMPPTNANGSINTAAQAAAVNQIISAAVTNDLANIPAGTNLQDLQWFSLDVTTAMNDNNGVMTLLTPGASLRIIDSYVVSSTSNGIVNWSTANSGISSAVQSLITAGLVKIPPGMTQLEIVSFAEQVAQSIYTYKVATSRTTL